MTPMRWCKNTNSILPRYFLQDFDLVKHPNPEHKEAWYAPGPLAFLNVMPWSVQRPGQNNESIADTQTPEIESGKDEALHTETSAESEDVLESKETEFAEDKMLEEAEEETELSEEISEDLHRSGRYVSYALSRKNVIDMLGRSLSLRAKMGGARGGMATYGLPSIKERVFRPDMGDLLLKMMRRQATDALVARSSSKREGKDPHKFIMPVSSWEEAQRTVAGGAVLYIPTEPTEDMNNYATLDVENANYGGKVAVHDLNFILGEPEVKRLREEAKDFRDQELLILKNHRSESIRSLFLLLWRLQGYLAEPQIELVEPREY